jgi:hypothetical protein
VISITRKPNGRTVEAHVVDECDTVDTSTAVWKALGLDNNISEVLATWCDA